MFIMRPKHHTYNAAMVRTDAFSTYYAVIPVANKTENELELGMIQASVMRGKPPQTVSANGETGIPKKGCTEHTWTNTS